MYIYTFNILLDTGIILQSYFVTLAKKNIEPKRTDIGSDAKWFIMADALGKNEFLAFILFHRIASFVLGFPSSK